MSSAIAARLPAVPSRSTPGPAAAVGRTGGPRRARILLAIDGSPASADACRAAAALARWVGARVLVLHIAEPNWPRSSLDRAHGAVAAEEAARTNGIEIVERARALLRGVPCAPEVCFGDPTDVIVRRAREMGADLVVLGSRGLGLLDRLLLGSVSDRVARRAPCPVLIVRGDGARLWDATGPDRWDRDALRQTPRVGPDRTPSGRGRRRRDGGRRRARTTRSRRVSGAPRSTLGRSSGRGVASAPTMRL